MIFFNIFRYEETNSLPILVTKLNDWNSNLSIKQQYLYSFSAYLMSECTGISEKYKAFCDESFSYLGIKNK